MSQETDASALIGLIWLAWICWSIRSWLEHPRAGDDAQHREAATDAVARQTPPVPRFSSSTDMIARAPPAGPLAAFIAQIRQSDRSFDVHAFLDSATAAYEAVVIAFAAGDRHTLKMLLSGEVHDAFSAIIAAREARGEHGEAMFSRIDAPEIRDGYCSAGMEVFSIRFTGDLFRTVLDAHGKAIEGSPVSHERVSDTWVFGRPQASTDPAWQIVATNAAARVAVADIEECCV